MNKKTLKWNREYDYETGKEYLITENNISEIKYQKCMLFIEGRYFKTCNEAAYYMENKENLEFKEVA
jgi:nuclear transport factor 2 (NTF2) superfamily protein